MYVIAPCSGKGFLEKSRKFTITGHAGNVWVLDDSTDAKQWADEQFGQIVDKATAQAAINDGTPDVDFDGNSITPHQL